jgi:hypothetical protein
MKLDAEPRSSECIFNIFNIAQDHHRIAVPCEMSKIQSGSQAVSPR